MAYCITHPQILRYFYHTKIDAREAKSVPPHFAKCGGTSVSLYGNATSTVKKRNDFSPPAGTSLHFHLILELQLTTPTKFIPFTVMRGT